VPIEYTTSEAISGSRASDDLACGCADPSAADPLSHQRCLGAGLRPQRRQGLPHSARCRLLHRPPLRAHHPDNLGDLYRLPPGALTRIKEVLMERPAGAPRERGAGGPIPLRQRFFIVESFQAQGSAVTVVTDPRITRLRDLRSGQVLTGQARGNRMTFDRAGHGAHISRLRRGKGAVSVRRSPVGQRHRPNSPAGDTCGC